MDVKEFKQRFIPCSQNMYWTAYRLSGSDSEAQDIVQETFLRLWTHREKLSEVINAEAYCVRMVRNVFVDMHRVKKLKIAAIDGEVVRVADADDVGQGMEQRQMADVAKQMIDKLPEQQRKIIMMKDVEDYSYDEIAEATGMNGSTIRTTLSRARKTVRKMFNSVGLTKQ